MDVTVAQRGASSSRGRDALPAVQGGTHAPLLGAVIASVPVLLWSAWSAGWVGAAVGLAGFACVLVFYGLGAPVERAALRRADVAGLAGVLAGYAVRLAIVAGLLWAITGWNDGRVPAGGVAAAVAAPTLGWVTGLAWGAWHARQFVYDQSVVATRDEKDEDR